MIDIKAAQEELEKKSYNDIQVETAWKWASRAVATVKNVLIAKNEDKVALLIVGEEYSHDAVEHAAVAEDWECVGVIKEAIIESSAAAASDARSSLGIDL